MRQLAAGVSVVTVGQGEARTGFTATSVTSLAVEPPRLLVCVGRDSSSWPALREAGAFCANVLDASQQWLADRFAGRDGIYGPARYEGVSWHAMPSGAAALAGALASIDCVLEEAIECHSHVILIGAVEAVLLGPAEASPLLYWRGDYRRLDPGS
ncbi:MAG TPA: flavin reductase family protein [Devosiaceae bacterium]|jgi:flavin reductase (DIM6/NTAB) family NADH-FMN oxidoreductase RutF|nr:flavin reductase family protein [Devosiaceae bacterium]